MTKYATLYGTHRSTRRYKTIIKVLLHNSLNFGVPRSIYNKQYYKFIVSAPESKRGGGELRDLMIRASNSLVMIICDKERVNSYDVKKCLRRPIQFGYCGRFLNSNWKRYGNYINVLSGTENNTRHSVVSLSLIHIFPLYTQTSRPRWCFKRMPCYSVSKRCWSSGLVLSLIHI